MSRYTIEVRQMKDFDVKEADVLTLTEAAQRLGLSTSAMSDLTLRGALRRLVDNQEPNPTKANRVLVEDVEKELQRRRERHDDRRLKQKRGRLAGV